MRDEDRLGHVGGNERQPAAVFGKAGPDRRCTLGMIEEAIALAKDEVVLVPESGLCAEGLVHGLSDRG
jgi:hypothetical protein